MGAGCGMSISSHLCLNLLSPACAAAMTAEDATPRSRSLPALTPCLTFCFPPTPCHTLRLPSPLLCLCTPLP